MSAQPEAHITVASIDLLSSALRSLDDAIVASRSSDKYIAAHLAALRAAAALLAAHTQPHNRRPTSAWTLVAKVSPDLAEWAGFFAAGASKRAAAQAGVTGIVTDREADDLVREAHQFIDLVSLKLGVSRQLTLPVSSNVLEFRPRPSS